MSTHTTFHDLACALRDALDERRAAVRALARISRATRHRDQGSNRRVHRARARLAAAHEAVLAAADAIEVAGGRVEWGSDGLSGRVIDRRGIVRID